MHRLHPNEIGSDQADDDRKEEPQRDAHEWVHEVTDKVVAGWNIWRVSG